MTRFTPFRRHGAQPLEADSRPERVGVSNRLKAFPNGTPVAERWIEKRADGCWVWLGSKMVAGYGLFRERGRMVSAHRRSFVEAHGPIPDGMWVLHRCDNPPCVNPDHLFLGTPRDNVIDMIAKGRRPPRGGKPTCRRGHIFDEQNTIWRPRGRMCRACKDVTDAAHRARARALRSETQGASQ